MQEQLVALKRTVQLSLNGHTLQGTLVHSAIEEPVGVAAAVLGPIHRQICRREQRLRGPRVAWPHGNACRDAREHVNRAKRDRLAQAPEETVDRKYNVVVLAHAFEQHREFIPAQPGDRAYAAFD